MHGNVTIMAASNHMFSILLTKYYGNYPMPVYFKTGLTKKKYTVFAKFSYLGYNTWLLTAYQDAGKHVLTIWSKCKFQVKLQLRITNS